MNFLNRIGKEICPVSTDFSETGTSSKRRIIRIRFFKRGLFSLFAVLVWGGFLLLSTADSGFGFVFLQNDENFSPSDSKIKTLSPISPLEQTAENDLFLDNETAAPFLSADEEKESISESRVTRFQNSWGLFNPGSWITTRTQSVSYSDQTIIASQKDGKKTLEKVNAQSFQLREEGIVRIGLRQLVTDSVLKTYDFFNQPIDEQKKTVQMLKPQCLVIGGKQIPCEVIYYEVLTSQWKEKTTVWYSPVFMPYLLQKETVLAALPSKEKIAENKTKETKEKTGETISGLEEKIISHSQMTVQKTSANAILGQKMLTWRSETVKTQGNRVSTTTSMHSALVPGNLLRETTEETDSQGNLLFKSTTVLLNYFVN